MLLALLASCNNSSAIENLVSADPQLSKNANDSEEIEGAETATPQTERSNNSADSFLESKATSETQPEAKANLARFPDFIPVYRPAELDQAELEATDEKGTAVWRSPDEIDRIAGYYQERLRSERWEIIQPFNLAPEIETSEAIATKNNLEITVSLEQLSSNEATDTANTQLTISYQPTKSGANSEILTQATPEELRSAPSDTAVAEELENTTNDTLDNSEPVETEAKAAPVKTLTEVNFTDLDEVPEQLQQYVRDVAKLGILTPYTQGGNVAMNEFAPNQPITRSEYARWLIAANNEYYRDSPSQKIYETKNPEKPAFNDVNFDHPDFSAIQGLAEAGLIPSILTDDSSNLLFQPNAPLTREDLVTWKVPLDTRKALPQADIEAIKETWGFQDTADIDSIALKALFADFQNRDRSNIGRSFGYTTLFQPQKPVTRAEAAASLWYFGFQGEGISAPEASENFQSTETE
ncbi:S-layer homology domain-containing protein [Myxosarcina sp. GI1(2024)]